MKNNRSKYIDLVKAFAIITVVVGHCIQYGSGIEFIQKNNFFYNKLFIVIYSFHMPLFAVVSGYLFYNSVNKYEFKKLIKRKFICILIPLMTFSAVFLMLHSIKNNVKFTALTLISSYVSTVVGVYWFLFAILVFQIIVMINNRFFKDNAFVYIFIFLITFFISYKPLATTLYVYPFFIIGYIYNKHNTKQYYYSWKKIIIPISVIIYIVLIFKYTYESYIYTSGYYVLIDNKINVHQLYVDMYRFFVGLFGIIAIMSILEIVDCKLGSKWSEITEYISKNSIIIYLISCNTNIFLLTEMTKDIECFMYSYIIIESFITILVSLIVGKLLDINKITKLLFLGRISNKNYR